MTQNPTPKVTLLTWTKDPLETVYAVWEQSKGEAPLMSIEDVKRNIPKADVEKLFRAVIAQKIPIGEHISFIFILENISISWREQAVRHRIGTLASPERVGADMVHMEKLPDLADSSWWSQCFTGDTRIRLLDGTEPTLAALAERGGYFWVYSCDKKGRIVPGRGHSARKTGTKPLVEVELDSGERIRCTADHLWLGRDGQYIEARLLQPGASLMPLYTRLDKHGYEQYADLATGRYLYTHQMVDRELNGWLPDGQVIHHASFDKRNNSPDCLERMSDKDHFALHAALIIDRMEADPAGHRLALSVAQKARWEKMSEATRIKALDQLARAREAIDPVRLSEAARGLMNQRWTEREWRGKMAPVLAQNGQKTKGRKQSQAERHRRSIVAKERFARQKAEGALPVGFNHKVVAVRVLDEVADVYDITVDKHHNFALASGVFVHNSMRIQDMSAFARRRAYRLPQTVEDKGPEAVALFHKTMDQIGSAYNELVDMGIPMEDARELMPLGAQHRMSWMLNIGSLQHIVGKRGCWILQLGIWGPIIEGMITELAAKVHPIFSEVVTPPCLKGDDYKGCVYQEEVRRRYTGDDKLPPCTLHFHHEVASEAERSAGKTHLPVIHDAHAVPRAAEMRDRAEQYRAFWGRDPYTGKRLG
jgi:thymidylate synthase ThyX